MGNTSRSCYYWCITVICDHSISAFCMWNEICLHAPQSHKRLMSDIYFNPRWLQSCSYSTEMLTATPTPPAQGIEIFNRHHSNILTLRNLNGITDTHSVIFTLSPSPQGIPLYFDNDDYFPCHRGLHFYRFICHTHSSCTFHNHCNTSRLTFSARYRKKKCLKARLSARNSAGNLPLTALGSVNGLSDCRLLSRPNLNRESLWSFCLKVAEAFWQPRRKPLQPA